MSMAHNSIAGAHLEFKRTKDMAFSNFYRSGVDDDVTRYCQSCDLCQRTVKKGKTIQGPMHILEEFWTKEIQEPNVKLSYDYVFKLRPRLDDTMRLTVRSYKKAQTKQKHYQDLTARKQALHGRQGVILPPT
ncbi:Zinc finger protein [Plakobranchus ocellatus]|uniref:Zinc finger protein n=1 Tax=Plakobranchus ocellatus TaxID=259542 RepID=A0AAV3ZJK3_9GAST|nr:Zinc finger protein [Plakobranchus ocellatus]